MKYLTLLILLSACATEQKVQEPTFGSVTLEDLMRSSYFSGCIDNGLFHYTNYKNTDELREKCENSEKEFDLYKTGLYDRGMKLRGEK